MPNSKMEASATPQISTSNGRAEKSIAAWIACVPLTMREMLLADLSEKSLAALPYLFDLWALPHQLPPKGNWRNWVILGGRGAGKTRAGAEWIRAQVEGGTPLARGKCQRLALVGETYDQVRDVMIQGDSGLLACSPADRRPQWRATERKLLWPNGAMAQAFSAHDPEALRGPQFDAAWLDELAKWKRAREAWDMLQFALRLGRDPRACITTTPRNTQILRDILAQGSTVQTHAPTYANRANLAASFLEEMQQRYGGSRLGRQELEGVLLSEVEGALWRPSEFLTLRRETLPSLDRIVVSVDPAVSAGKTSDACGIVVVGAALSGPPSDWQAYVLADRTLHGAGPLTWAKAVIAARDEFCADRVVAEVNQGGALVENLLRQIDPLVPFHARHAHRGKAARAEPVAALYEQGRVFHLPDLCELEEQMCLMTPQGFRGPGSPDRVDALVWAITELVLDPAARHRMPRTRVL